MVQLPSTTMTNELYPGATPLELRAIHEIVALAMDAPIAAKSGHTGTAMALAPLGVALFSRVMTRQTPSGRTATDSFCRVVTRLSFSMDWHTPSGTTSRRKICEHFASLTAAPPGTLRWA